MKLKAHLDTISVASFIPMRLTEVLRNGCRERKILPAIHNLIFIYTTCTFLNNLKEELEHRLPIRYIIDKATSSPIVIPEREMQNFILVSNTLNEQLIYLTHLEPTLKLGKKVRIKEGIFSGVEGTVVRMRRDRRVLVVIDELIAVATVHIHPSMLEEIDN